MVRRVQRQRILLSPNGTVRVDYVAAVVVVDYVVVLVVVVVVVVVVVDFFDKNNT